LSSSSTWPHRQDSQKLVALAKQGSRQLEEFFSQERAERARARSGANWEPGEAPRER
jgi:hypothetical protein